MKVTFTSNGWILIIVIISYMSLLAIILARTSYVTDRCEYLKEKYQSTVIPKDNPDYREYLDQNNNGIACE
jgi:CTP:phosphocholine cytidylyltransferase-like protein